MDERLCCPSLMPLSKSRTRVRRRREGKANCKGQTLLRGEGDNKDLAATTYLYDPTKNPYLLSLHKNCAFVPLYALNKVDQVASLERNLVVSSGENLPCRTSRKGSGRSENHYRVAEE